MKKKLSYDEYGGAPLVGVGGVAIVCHGSSKREGHRPRRPRRPPPPRAPA